MTTASDLMDLEFAVMEGMGMNVSSPENGIPPPPGSLEATARPATASGTLETCTPESSNPSPQTFRLQAKQMLLTYPRCQTAPPVVMKNVLSFFGADVISVVVCREQHEDGSPHIHAAVKLRTQFRTRSQSMLDVLVDPPQHGNYKGVQSWIGTVRYCAKEGDFVTHGIDLPKFLSAAAKKVSTSSKTLQVVQAVQDGASVSDLIVSQPAYMLAHARNVKEFILLSRMASLQTRRQSAGNGPLPVRTVGSHNTTYNRAITAWIQSNIRVERQFKQAQLYLYGIPDIGKTSMVNWLENEFDLVIYHMPRNEEFYDEYVDRAYDLIVLDEFKAQKRIQVLNSWLEGGTMVVRQKGGQSLKRDNLPMIVLSNFSPQDCYSKCSEEQLAPLLSRLTVVYADGPIRLERACAALDDD